MVAYSPVKISLLTAIIVIILTKLPGWVKLIRRKGLKQIIIQKVSRFLLRFKYFKKQFQQKNDATKEELLKVMLAHREDPITALPASGIDTKTLFERLSKWAERDVEFQKGGRISGAIYHGGKNLQVIAAKAMKSFIISNPLHPEIFPAVRQMESEIVQITINLFNGGPNACGILTQGGTESLLLAMLAYREWGREQGITEPEILAPVSVHAAVDKAAHYFGMELVHVKLGPDFKVDINAVRKKISRNTVVIIGSAPCYAYGVIDNLEELGKLAIKHKKNFHIDGCLGGFLHPFMKDAGYNIPLCDFSVPGVTSISCDPHKYGYTPKGVSCLMFANQELRKYSYFVSPTWTGGIYATPTLSGSRTGCISVGAWTTLLSMGRASYIECAKSIMDAATYIKREIVKVPHIELMGDPLMSVVAFQSKTVNVWAIVSAMSRIGGWGLNAIQNPPGAHLCVTYANAPQAEKFIEDLRKAVEEVLKSPDVNAYHTCQLYGMVTSFPDKKIVGDIMSNYVDCLFTA
ncbi:unnamed protein product [Blepharisma stoltei]|uniref:sphinganine-1-phosphate aldolase n=1 Tax=Blepharisma stoltei TaxID=1481888 RepID=A0AAU9J2D3_9CILI|nr:unnamed protein product [Blepharisma stoltei]